MSNPNDDPDVISGLCDDAKKEMATTPGPSQRQSSGPTPQAKEQGSKGSQSGGRRTAATAASSSVQVMRSGSAVVPESPTAQQLCEGLSDRMMGLILASCAALRVCVQASPRLRAGCP